MDPGSRQMFQNGRSEDFDKANGPFASKSNRRTAAPTFEMHSSVGAGLLAKADSQTTLNQAPGMKCFCAVPRAIRREM